MDSAFVEMDLIARLFAVPLDVADGPSAARVGALAQLPDPLRLGRRMAALYTCWQHRLPDLGSLAAMLLRRIGMGADDALGRCCLDAARAVDAWGGLPYHSAAHHAEVATNAMVLVELADLLGYPVGQRGAAMLLVAGVAHDLHYTTPNGRPRFTAECASAEALDVIAAQAGCSEADRRSLRALVIATEPGLRLRDGGPLGEPMEPSALALLQTARLDPALPRLAEILSDADLLSSVGLTPRWYRVQQARLEAESGRLQQTEESHRFFSSIVGPDFLSPPGRVFSGNLAAIRAFACGAA